MPVNNSSYQKNSNISLVVRTIWKHKNISRVALSRELGLYRSTVTNIISYLIEKGIVIEGEAMSSNSHGGRKAVELAINPEFGCVFGFDIQPSHFRAVILAFDGTELWKYTEPLKSEKVEDRVVEAMEIALRERDRLNIPLIGVQFCFPGIINTEEGRIIYSWPFKGENIDIKGIIQSRYDVPVYVANDADAAAWYDISTGILNSQDNALAIVADYHDEESDVAIGVGFSTIINGTVYHGSHHAAGEFVSLSWKPGMDDQSGIPSEYLSDLRYNKDHWELWMGDTFHSLVPLIAVMDFSKVILHGTPFSEEERVMDYLNNKLPVFISVLNKVGCELIIDAGMEIVSALGAGLDCIQKIFYVPSLEEEVPSFSTHWENVISLSEGQR